LKVVHGDPRLPNILKFESHLRWIDFRYNLPFTDDNIVTDVKILMRSLISNLGEEEIESKTDNINEYVVHLLNSDNDDKNNALKILLSLFGINM
jgi:hypothetical protein